MRIRVKRRLGRNDLVVVIFEEDSNFNPDDLSWTPTKEEISNIYWAMKRVGAWDQERAYEEDKANFKVLA